MKALLCTRYGTPDDLTLADIPDPVLGPGEVAVQIEAAALNFFDTLIIATSRRCHFHRPQNLPEQSRV